MGSGLFHCSTSKIIRARWENRRKTNDQDEYRNHINKKVKERKGKENEKIELEDF